jgi:hypothetical protein
MPSTGGTAAIIVAIVVIKIGRSRKGPAFFIDSSAPSPSCSFT